MTVNLYNKVYKSVRESNTQFKNGEDTIAFILKAAGKYMQKAYDAQEAGDFVERSNQSDNALMLLSGIRSAIEQFTKEDDNKMEHLNDFCIAISNCIVRMNVASDLDMAKGIVEALNRMGDDWARKANIREEDDFADVRKKQAEQGDLTGSITTSQKASGPYPTADYTPNTSVVG